VKFSDRYVRQIHKEIKRMFEINPETFDLSELDFLKDSIYAFSKSKSKIARVCSTIWLPKDKTNQVLAEQTLNILLNDKRTEVRSRAVLGLFRIGSKLETYYNLIELIKKEKNHQVLASACQTICLYACNYFPSLIESTINLVQEYAQDERKSMCLAVMLVGLWALSDESIEEDIDIIFEEFLSGDEQEMETKSLSIVEILEIDLQLGYKRRYNKVCKFIKVSKSPLLKYNRIIFERILQLGNNEEVKSVWNIKKHYRMKSN